MHSNPNRNPVALLIVFNRINTLAVAFVVIMLFSNLHSVCGLAVRIKPARNIVYNSSPRPRLLSSDNKIRASDWDASNGKMTAKDELEGNIYSQAISWYPGHIAKAERNLQEFLKKVDVVVEVRDARIPLSTTHPMVPTWLGKKPLIIAIAREDQISVEALKHWKKYYNTHPAHAERPDAKVYFIDGKRGSGVITLKKQMLKAGEEVNARRAARGMKPRPVRAAVIGFPNVGKSALINRLLGRRLAKSQNLPGVTKALQWVRVGGKAAKTVNQGPAEHQLEILDSPGIIPARHTDQAGAIKLAICNDIGVASYDRVVVAGAMCDMLTEINALPSYVSKAFVDMKKIAERYQDVMQLQASASGAAETFIPFAQQTGEEIVYNLAHRRFNGNLESAADRLLSDFRKGYLGYSSLEVPPSGLKKLLDPQKQSSESKKRNNLKNDRFQDSSPSSDSLGNSINMYSNSDVNRNKPIVTNSMGSCGSSGPVSSTIAVATVPTAARQQLEEQRVPVVSAESKLIDR